MASGEGVNARLQAQGWGLIGLAQGLAALGAAVGFGSPAVVALMPVSWGRVLGGGRAVPSFLSAFAPRRAAAPAASVAAVAARPAVSLEEVLALVQRTAGGA